MDISKDQDSRATESYISFQTAQGLELRAGVVRVTRFLAAFEIYDASCVLRSTEVLTAFQIILNGKLVYKGKAVVSHFMNTGLTTVAEATLEESWLDVDLGSTRGAKLRAQYEEFTLACQKDYHILPEFKLVVADMQTFLLQLRGWMEQLELGGRSAKDHSQFEQQVLDDLVESVLPKCFSHFLEFEEVCKKIPADMQPAHSRYVKRQLHPLVLCSPFMYRTFAKPLGYAGDYEMVNMMVRPPYEGASLFAKILNTFFLNTAPVVAHRNRITYLYNCLVTEATKARQAGRTARIFNLGCGPAKEVQDFLRNRELAQHTQFTLLDFNEETLLYTQKTLEEVKNKAHATTSIKLVKKSVAQLLKDHAKADTGGLQYDYVYCAGLFDYLPDPVCARLVTQFYKMVAPGGLLVVTNVDSSNNYRQWMDYSVDWYLIYRNHRGMASLAPQNVSPEDITLRSDPTGVNIFMEIRKPQSGL